MNVRTDLLHLSPEALAQIANVGVVKRAVRELEGGYAPAIDVEDDGTLRARFGDGVEVLWPPAVPIDRCRCSCGAPTVCRHRVIAALQYRASRSAAAAESPASPSPGDSREHTAAGPAPAAPLEIARSPGAATDADLARVLASGVLTLARREADAGVVVEIRRRASGEPCDTARLPAATVRYWAGAELEAARCDCVRATACEHVAIGVWAFRQADAAAASDPATAVARIRLGAEGARVSLDGAPFTGLVDALLRHGVTAGASPLAQALTRALAAGDALGATWLEHLVRDLERWSGAYEARSALYEPESGVDLLAELALRLAAGRLPGNGRAVLGVGEAREVELDKLRLACLGARTVRDGDRRHTRLIMADETTGTRFALLHDWAVPEDREEARERAGQRVAAGVRLEQIAGGQLLAQHARRFADGTLQLARSRSSMNSVLPQAGDWSTLGAPLRYDRVSRLRELQQAQPNEALQPRHAAARFVVFTPSAVRDTFFDPNAQTLAIVLVDADGDVLLVERRYESHVPHALDALAAVARDGIGHVAGVLRWNGAIPIVEPWAVVTAAGENRVVVPDFAAATGALADVRLGVAPPEHDGAVDRLLASCRRLAGELLHHGLVGVPPSWGADTQILVRQLRGAGLNALGAEIQEWSARCVAARQTRADDELASATLRCLALQRLHEEASLATSAALSPISRTAHSASSLLRT